LPAPLAHDDRVPAFGDDPGEARYAEEMEPGADHRVVAAQHPRDVHHALGRNLVRALVYPVPRGLFLPGVPRPRRRGELYPVRETTAAARDRNPARVDGESRGEIRLQ